MKAGSRKLGLAVVALACLAPAAPASAQVSLASPLRAVFLKEYSKSSYAMAQGQILAFENDDPFLSHGVVSTFGAPTIPPGSTSLVRNAPFLGPGTYFFQCPVHPEMRSSLMITKDGAPLPPDSTPPKAKIRIVSNGRQLVNAGKVKVRAAPNEPVDVAIAARVGKIKLGTATSAFPTGKAGAVKLAFEPAVAARIPRTFTLAVRATVTDAAGNKVKVRTKRRLAGGR